MLAISAHDRSVVQRVLTIAGSDPTGAAGAQADLKTFASNGVDGMAVLTLLTAQTDAGVSSVKFLDATEVSAQLEAALSLSPAAIKIGAVGHADVVRAVAKSLAEYRGPIVYDSVLAPTRGVPFSDDAAVSVIASKLLPQVTVFTPNAIEAMRFGSRAVDGEVSAEEAARELLARVGHGRRADGARIDGAVVLKGGHWGAGDDVVDFVATDGGVARYGWPRVSEKRGTGCALSSAIAARMAQGDDVQMAYRAAREWLADAMGCAGTRLRW
ncbi:MAG: hydroxymethylpyrimidine/phosphomethylpyrimidine kinase [Polyangiales bacterium]